MESIRDRLKAGFEALKAGHAESALAAAEATLEEQPGSLDALILAGQALQALERTAEAASRLQEALARSPGHAGLLSNLSALHLALGEAARARDLAQDAVARAPAHYGAHLNLGLAALALKDYPFAESMLERALELKPDDAAATRGLAVARYRGGRAHLSARPLLEKSAVLFPEDHEVRALLADSFIQTADIAQGLAAYRDLLENDANIPAEARLRYHGGYLVALQYDPDKGPEDLLHAASARGAGLVAGETARTAPPAGGKLRVGWLSPRFGPGPVAGFLLPVLAAFDREGCEHVLYPTYSQPGSIREEFRALADHWVDLEGLSAEQAANKIAADGLNVLVDLAGHATGGRLDVFRFRPAPVQVSWLDSFATTGLPEMDGFISDRELTPEGEERWFSEKLIRLESGRLCYRPQEEVPEPVSRQDQELVFGCFNRLSKLNDAVLEAWSKILEAVPGSRLRLRNSLFEDPMVQSDFIGRCERAGLPGHRLSLHGYCSYREIMADYGNIDIALDTFPFSGCATTCDALWMGVPVITRGGRTLASRQSAAILGQLGHAEWVTDSREAFIAAAVALANDSKQRDICRTRLRAEMRKRFVPADCAGELLSVFRQMTELASN